jgi:cation diffusion facilitator CzcD-associated flavoprotein CzcO
VGWQKKRMENFDRFIGGNWAQGDMVHDGWTDIMRDLAAKNVDMRDPIVAEAEHQLADFKKMSKIRARCDSLVHNKETAEALKAWYNHFCKRPCFHDEYLQTFDRPNVTLVDTKGAGVTRLTEKGVIANGVEHEIDCLVFATGFEYATDWSHRTGIEIYGRDGLTITNKWKDGASKLHGWTSRGFPNCFWLQVSQAAVTPNTQHVVGEQAKHLAYVISECKKREIRSVEPTV